MSSRRREKLDFIVSSETNVHALRQMKRLRRRARPASSAFCLRYTLLMNERGVSSVGDAAGSNSRSRLLHRRRSRPPGHDREHLDGAAESVARAGTACRPPSGIKPRSAGNQPPSSPATGHQPNPRSLRRLQAFRSTSAPASCSSFNKARRARHPVPSISGAWGETSSAALAKFQEKAGLDPGGDLDELTLARARDATGAAGECRRAPMRRSRRKPPASGGAPVALSPRLARLVQTKLTEAGFPTDNVFGIWLAGSETAARDFQKAKGLDITATLDLRLIHALGLTAALTDPKPGKLPTDSVAQILSEKAVAFTGAPVSISPAGIRQIQMALQQRGHKEVRSTAGGTTPPRPALKKFQESAEARADRQRQPANLRALWASTARWPISTTLRLRPDTLITNARPMARTSKAPSDSPCRTPASSCTMSFAPARLEPAWAQPERATRDAGDARRRRPQ